MKNIVFDPKAFKQFNEWAIEDKKLYKKIVDLIDDILRHPFSGIGKPEPLKHQLKGYWSRRINIVYQYKHRSCSAIAHPQNPTDKSKAK